MEPTRDQSPGDGGGSRRMRVFIGFLVIVAAVVVLVARANRDTMVYYVTVSELLDPARSARASGLRVTGNVVPGTIERQQLELRFEMTDGQKAIPVRYTGVVPDTFGEEGEVVVEGALASDGAFEASFLMAKCPSKYDAAPTEGEQAEHPEGIPKGTY